MNHRFDAIVVGAGPAGSAAAYMLARKGTNVLCLERGEYPGAKNVSGGILYGEPFQDLADNEKGEWPRERRIVKHVLAMAAGNNLTSFTYQRTGGEVPLAFSVLRAGFDRWLSARARQAGARILTEAPVDEVIWKNGRAVGVKVRRPGGDVFAPCIILADGANSLLGKKAGLRADYKIGQMSLAVKEIIKLSKETIDARFGLNVEEGAAYSIIGEATHGLEGGAFLYTNRESLSLGLVCHMDALVREKIKIRTLLDRFKQIPWISALIQGGVFKEYSAHLIPTLGFRERPRPFTHGILAAGDAAGFTLNTGFQVRGMDFALASGTAAAETVLDAHRKGDFSSKTMAAYEERLKDGYIRKDLNTFRRLETAMKNRALYAVYPKVIGEAFADLYLGAGKPKKRMGRLLWDHLRSHRGLRDLVKDLFFLRRFL
jgi:electron transfer flavoprotein-quinone oxidoreductase